MRDASAEAVRLRSRVRELEARLRHAMSGACAERVRLRARVRELEARLRRYKPTHCIAPVRPNNGVPARGRCELYTHDPADATAERSGCFVKQ